MIAGFFYALSACLLWGTIFVIPQYLLEFSALEVALGRYLSLGLFSVFLLLVRGVEKQPWRVWVVAATFGLIANVLYYMGIVVGVRYIEPALVVLVVGMCPVFAALYGNWGKGGSLFLPCLAMTVGVVLVNVMEIDWTFSTSSLQDYLIGMAGACTALLAWSWYAIQNARFLKQHPLIARSDWATMIGASTLFWVLLLGTFLSLGNHPLIEVTKLLQWTPATLKFILLMAFLGIACAWLGCYLWNQASSLLPLRLTGPMIIFETLFGLLFVFLYEKRLPSGIEFLGIFIMLAGIFFSFTDRALERNCCDRKRQCTLRKDT